MLLRQLRLLLLLLLPYSCLQSSSFLTNAQALDGESTTASSSSSIPVASTVVVMGLPRSGSEAIHNFFQCLNDDSQDERKERYSSVHYCCDVTPNVLKLKKQQQPKKRRRRRKNAAQPPPFATRPINLNATKGATTRFPCPDYQTTCGECVHANLLYGRPAFEGCRNSDDMNDNDPSSPTTTSTVTHRVYAQFDVETADPYSWFLPQHFALPLLLPDDTMDSGSVRTDTPPTETTASSLSSPHIVWILNQRESAEQWATNVLHWYSVTRRLFNSFDVPYHEDEHDNHGRDDSAEILAAIKAEAAESGFGIPITHKHQHWYTALERSYQRVHNVTAHERRHAILVDIYRRHAQKIQDFVDSLHQTVSGQKSTIPGTGNSTKRNGIVAPTIPRLVHLSVDDVDAGLHLAQAFGLHDDTQRAQDCWSFDAAPLDNDWQDFLLSL